MRRRLARTRMHHRGRSRQPARSRRPPRPRDASPPAQTRGVRHVCRVHRAQRWVARRVSGPPARAPGREPSPRKAPVPPPARRPRRPGDSAACAASRRTRRLSNVGRAGLVGPSACAACHEGPIDLPSTFRRDRIAGSRQSPRIATDRMHDRSPHMGRLGWRRSWSTYATDSTRDRGDTESSRGPDGAADETATRSGGGTVAGGTVMHGTSTRTARIGGGRDGSGRAVHDGSPDDNGASRPGGSRRRVEVSGSRFAARPE